MSAIDVSTLAEELASAKSIFEVLELTGRAQAAVAQRTRDVRVSVDEVAKATNEVKGALDALTCEVGKLPLPLTQIGEHLSQLIVEVRNHKDCVDANLSRLCEAVRPISERILPETATPAIPGYEFFKIAALGDASEATRAQLDLLGQKVDAAMRREKLAEFLEHIRRWEEDPGSSQDPETPRKRRTLFSRGADR